MSVMHRMRNASGSHFRYSYFYAYLSSQIIRVHPLTVLISSASPRWRPGLEISGVTLRTDIPGLPRHPWNPTAENVVVNIKAHGLFQTKRTNYVGDAT